MCAAVGGVGDGARHRLQRRARAARRGRRVARPRAHARHERDVPRHRRRQRHRRGAARTPSARAGSGAVPHALWRRSRRRLLLAREPRAGATVEPAHVAERAVAARRDWTTETSSAGVRAGDRRALGARDHARRERRSARLRRRRATSIRTPGTPTRSASPGRPASASRASSRRSSATSARRRRPSASISVDPSSPFTKGALLGDRIRLADHFLDPGRLHPLDGDARPSRRARRGDAAGAARARRGRQGRRLPRDRRRRSERGGGDRRSPTPSCSCSCPAPATRCRR